MRNITEAYDTYEDQADYEWDDYDAPEDREPRPRIMWGRLITLVAFVLIAFLIGRWSVADDGITPEQIGDLEAQVTNLETENRQLETTNKDLQTLVDSLESSSGNNSGDNNSGGGDESEDAGEGDEAAAAKSDVHVVEEGELLVGILEDKYSCKFVTNGTENISLITVVKDANGPDFKPSHLNPGQEITLPSIPSGYSCIDL